MERLEFEGKDLAEALRAAAERLGTPASSLRYEVLEEGRRGLLGLGGRLWRIRVEPSAPRAPVAPPRDVPQGLLDTVRRMVQLMGLDLAVSEGRSDSGVFLRLSGSDRGALLARDGELLRALQFLLNRMARRLWPEAGPIRLTCTGRGGSRKDVEIVELVREVAQQVVRTGRPKRLHPMNPYERRLAHLAVGEIPGLRSRSEGGGFLKTVVIEKATHGQAR